LVVRTISCSFITLHFTYTVYGLLIILKIYYRWRVFENMVLRVIFGRRRDEVTGNGGDCITRS